MPKHLDWEEGNQPNIWIHGDTGYGKSFQARKILGDRFYPKIASNKWWDKYKGEENVLIEDVDKTHTYQAYNFKIWADKYAFPVEIKYGNDVVRPKIIVVTSNYPIKEVFPDPRDHEPLLRRFKEVHKNVKWNATIDGVLKSKKVKAKESLVNKKAKKVKKNHMPLKKPALYKQNANGDIVPSKQDQMIIEDIIQSKPIGKSPKSFPTQDIDALIDLHLTQEIPKEKEIIELEDSIESISDECTGCPEINCICNHLLWNEDQWDDELYNKRKRKFQIDDTISDSDCIDFSDETVSTDLEEC